MWVEGDGKVDNQLTDTMSTGRFRSILQLGQKAYYVRRVRVFLEEPAGE